MKPKIQKISFGSIEIENTTYDYDVIIRSDGQIEKRKKKLSKSVYGTSHIISLDEAKYIYEDGTETIIIGSGMFDQCKLSNEAKAFFHDVKCDVNFLPTKQAVQVWNETEGTAIGMFHITC